MSEHSRLRWLCRRGMKELDVVLTGYLESHFELASEAEKKAFVELLDMHDPDLYALLMGRQSSPNQTIETVLGSIRDMFRHSPPILK